MITSVRPALLRGMLLLLLGMMATQVVMADPPGRVARINHSQGEVSYSPYGSNDWIAVNRNRALWRGDRLWADRRALAELQVGSAVLRMAQATSLEILDLDDQIAQFQVTQGSINLRVTRLYEGQVYEIATPTLAFTIDQPGRYRIDVDPRSNQTTIIVWEGGGDAWGDNSRFAVREGDAVRFGDSDLRRYTLFDPPRADAFDRYCMDRDRRLDRSPSLRYVGADLIGYADLDDYGSWRVVGNYGGVWFPRQVAADWAPYRDGHWVWQDPWGWTWVDDAPWGFAPSHYGRWVNVSNRWGWIPGPRTARVVYAPALVAFIGGNNWNGSRTRGNDAPVGWFPLGPREVYVPTYSASRSYFDRVNMSNTVITRTSITTIYNNYSSGRGSIAQERYVNRDIRGSVTAVPVSAFRTGRGVREAALSLDGDMLAAGQIARRIDITPDARSVRGYAADARAQPAAAVFDRNVLARHAAPARPDGWVETGVRDRSQADPARRASAPALQPDQSASDNVRLIQQRSVIDARAAGGDSRGRGEQRGATDRTGAGGPPQAPAETLDEAAVFQRAQQEQQRMIERQQVEQRGGERVQREQQQQAQQQQMDEQTGQRAQQRELRGQENELREQQQQQEQAQQRVERQQAVQAEQRAQQDQLQAEQRAQQAQQRELRSQENQLRKQEQAQAQQRTEQEQQQAVQAEQRAQQEQQQAQQREQQARLQAQQAEQAQQQAQQAQQAQQQAQQAQQQAQEREQRNLQGQRRAEEQGRPSQPQTEPPASDAAEEPRGRNSRRNQAPADPDAEASDPEQAEREKTEREKAERKKAEREKAEREKAEREKAEREKRGGKRDD